MKIKIKDIKEFVIFLSIIICILFSKTMFFGVENRSVFQYFFYSIAIIVLLIRGSKITLKENFLRFLPIYIIFIIHIIIDFKNFSDTGLNALLGDLCIFICCMLIASTISWKRFCKYYITIIVWMCIASIPFFLISIFDKELARQLCSTSLEWANKYEYSWFYTWGRHGIIYTRNSGMFWEPGAFQSFIVFAIVLLLANYNKYLEKSFHIKFKLVILFITLLTTQSTTGYFICLILVLAFMKPICEIFVVESKNKMILLFSVLFFVLGIVLYIALSQNISDKLLGVDNDSAQIRLKDLINSTEIVKNNAFWGLGRTVERDSLEVYYNLTSNSVGLLSMAYTYGLFFALYYLYLIVSSTINKFDNFSKINMVVIIVIFIILHMTEGLWGLPVFTLYLLNYRKEEVIYEKKNSIL